MIELAQPIATVIAGCGVLGAAGLTVRSAEQNRRQLADHHAREQRQVAEHHALDQRQNQDRLRAERFTACAGQLGHSSATVRTAGIHGLVALADEWISLGDAPPAQTVANVLCGYLRSDVDEASCREEMSVRTELLVELQLRGDWWQSQTDFGERIQRALPEVRVRGIAHSWHSLNTELHRAQLPGIALAHMGLAGVQFNAANLRAANLSSADLELANLTRADLTDADCANLYARNADFSHSILRDVNLYGASLGEADFTAADLSGADLRLAILTNADFDSAVLEGAKLTAGQVRSDIDEFTARGAVITDE